MRRNPAFCNHAESGLRGSDFWPTTPPWFRRIPFESLKDTQDQVSHLAVSGNIALKAGLDKRDFGANKEVTISQGPQYREQTSHC